MHPLNASVDELSAAIREALEEGKVRLETCHKVHYCYFWLGLLNRVIFVGNRKHFFVMYELNNRMIICDM